MQIDLKNISYQYSGKNKILNDISMTISDGVYGLLGENGAGKTTLIKLLATLNPIQKGSIIIDGLSVEKDYLNIRKRLGYLPQNIEFFKGLSVYDMLEYICVLKGLENNSYDEIKKLLIMFNLIDKKDDKISSLSGGMKQRLGIVQAFLGNPSLVILDEPTVGLDPTERLNFRNRINELSKDRIIIISTHIISDISVIAENIGIMKKGQLLYSGKVENLLKDVSGKICIEKHKTDEIIDQSLYKNIISINRISDYLEVRYIKDKDSDVGYEVKPNLEDAYFYIMKEKSYE